MGFVEHASVPWERGYYSKVWLRRIFDARPDGECAVWEEVIPPGGYISAHFHEFEEVLSILSGTAHVKSGGKIGELGPGSSVLLPAGAVHEVKTRGNESVRLLAFLATANPAVRYPEGRPAPAAWTQSDDSWAPA